MFAYVAAVACAFLAMLDFPLRQQVGSIREASLDAINIVFGDRLENNPAELIFQKPDLGSSLNPMLAAQLRWNDKLAFRGYRST